MIYKMTFNTGRQYTARGQVITASYDTEENVCVFNDHSRMITGTFIASMQENIDTEEGKRLFAREVVRIYDKSQYNMTCSALEECAEIHEYRL